MNLDRKLIAYAVAAAAADLAAAESAEGAIVSRPGFAFGSGSTSNIDFNAAGNEEYVIGHRTGPVRVQLLKDDQTLDINAYRTTSVLDNRPAALPAGTIIDSSGTYANTYDATLAHEDGSGTFAVDNIDGNPQYIGVRFQLSDPGTPLFGWIGLDITSTDGTGRVTGFAYEDSGGPIAAGAVPEPAGLALLALGAPFLLRRKRD